MVTHSLIPTEYLYRGHWIRADDLWHVSDVRGGLVLYSSESFDDCTEAIDQVVDDGVIEVVEG